MTYYMTDDTGRITAYAQHKFDKNCKETEREIIKVGTNLIFSDEIDVESLLKIKEEKISRLWSNYKSFQTKYMDAEDLTLAVSCAALGSTKGKEMQLWIMGLWQKYYTIKDTIEQTNSFSELIGIDLFPDSYGAPPYTIRELNEEAAEYINNLNS